MMLTHSKPNPLIPRKDSSTSKTGSKGSTSIKINDNYANWVKTEKVRKLQQQEQRLQELRKELAKQEEHLTKLGSIKIQSPSKNSSLFKTPNSTLERS